MECKTATIFRVMTQYIDIDSFVLFLSNIEFAMDRCKAIALQMTGNRQTAIVTGKP